MYLIFCQYESSHYLVENMILVSCSSLSTFLAMTCLVSFHFNPFIWSQKKKKKKKNTQDKWKLGCICSSIDQNCLIGLLHSLSKKIFGKCSRGLWIFVMNLYICSATNLCCTAVLKFLSMSRILPLYGFYISPNP